MQILWAQATDSSLRGLSLARETGWSLARDAGRWLYLFNRSGERQAQVQLPASPAQAACAADGHSFAVVSADRVSLLARDLMPRWERPLEHAALAVALSALGDFLVVSDASGEVHCFNQTGKHLWKTVLPRPCRYLGFVPEQPLVVACADFGLVVCLDPAGQVVWRDGLVAQVGSLSLAVQAEPIALACYGDGLWCYDLKGRKKQRTDLAPCFLADLSYTGDEVLTVGLEPKVRLLDRSGACLASAPLEGSPLAIALAPLADRAWVGLAQGKVLALQTRSAGA